VVCALVVGVIAAGAVVAGAWHRWGLRIAQGPSPSVEAVPSVTAGAARRPAPAGLVPGGIGVAHPAGVRGAVSIPPRSARASQTPAHPRAAATVPQGSPASQGRASSARPRSTAVYPAAPDRTTAVPQAAARSAAVHVPQAAPRAVTGAVRIHMTFRQQWRPFRFEVGPAPAPPPVTFVCPSCPPPAATTLDYSSAKSAYPSGSATMTSSY